MERCRLLTRARSQVERKELLGWKSRHARNKVTEKKEKGPVEPGKEEEEDKLESFFCHLHEFHSPVRDVPAFVPAELPHRYSINFVPVVVSNPVAASSSAISSAILSESPVISSRVFVPAELPARYAITFVSPAAFSGSPVSVPSTDYSVISSVNFVAPPPVIVCIEPNT